MNRGLQILSAAIVFFIVISCTEKKPEDATINYIVEYAEVMGISDSLIKDSNFPFFYKPFPILADSLTDFDINNLKYGQQFMSTDTLIFGENMPNCHPESQIGSKYSEVKKIFKSCPQVILIHCIWQTYETECWYIELPDTLIPIQGQLRKSRFPE